MLQVNFIIIYIIHKVLVLLKITRILKRFLRSIIELFIFLKIINFFSQHITMERSSLEEENTIKDVRKLFRLKKELEDTTIKDIRNPFRLKKENKVK